MHPHIGEIRIKFSICEKCGEIVKLAGRPKTTSRYTRHTATCGITSTSWPVTTGPSDQTDLPFMPCRPLSYCVLVLSQQHMSSFQTNILYVTCTMVNKPRSPTSPYHIKAPARVRFELPYL